MSSPETLKEECECVEEQCCKAANDAGRKIRRLVDVGSQDVKEQMDRVEDEIRRHPVQSSAIALGLGMLIGLLFRPHS